MIARDLGIHTSFCYSLLARSYIFAIVSAHCVRTSSARGIHVLSSAQLLPRVTDQVCEPERAGQTLEEVFSFPTHHAHAAVDRGRALLKQANGVPSMLFDICGHFVVASLSRQNS